MRVFEGECTTLGVSMGHSARYELALVTPSFCTMEQMMHQHPQH